MEKKTSIQLLQGKLFLTKPFDARLSLLYSFFFSLLSALLPIPANAVEQTKGYSEAQIKVALVYKLMHFMERPGNAPLTLCVYQPNAEDIASFRLMPSKTQSGKALKVMLLDENDPARNAHECKVSFVSSDVNQKDTQRFLAQASKEHSLTIGETDRFIQQGGMINLVRKDSTIKFEVNLSALKHAGINLSSQVLRIADHVYANGDKE